MGKWNLPRRISRALALPADAALPTPRLEVTGREDILLTGKTTLLEYAPECIRVARGDCEVTVLGAALRIAAMDRMGMQITGQIGGIGFREIVE